MPRKAAVLDLEDGDVEFQFYLAEKLGRFVFELDEMPFAEYVRWIAYYEKKAHRRKHAAAKPAGRR